jgi:hypothetical protein
MAMAIGKIWSDSDRMRSGAINPCRAAAASGNFKNRRNMYLQSWIAGPNDPAPAELHGNA